ncbi:16S rRNA (cytosine(1402)-N(4))-methyltransferase RsmH [Miltoncostaea marina]|uniref:16S rRNA (cytosine(1402)-N(4))-methyltransferase RsmH n=1 Tax=Miltoncostaea marina TaxID=2843215 RepID=UPI001C3C5E52|nr:16S rRNA (cytosine(1402)-N(4))-methyltransferase RsmH [Miltoncostaea marina]
MPSALPLESRSPARGHEPVLAEEVVAMLAPRAGETVVDCTFGAGGHARRIAPLLGERGRYIAVDRDPEARGWFAELAADVVCATRFVGANFADALPALAAEGVRADVVLMDLGLSSMQVDRPERGFSYSRQAPLDMRMDPHAGASAADIVATASERELADLMRTYGEERYARQIARAIVRRRAQEPITTTGDLVEVVRSAVPTPALFAGGHPAKRVFQALRIAVNDELGSLERGLAAAWELLAPGGRLAVISFHSLEDRMVKRFMRDRTRGCICPPEMPVCGCGREAEAALLAAKAKRPRQAELDRNPRARSALLRGVRRLEEAP